KVVVEDIVDEVHAEWLPPPGRGHGVAREHDVGAIVAERPSWKGGDQGTIRIPDAAMNGRSEEQRRRAAGTYPGAERPLHDRVRFGWLVGAECRGERDQSGFEVREGEGPEVIVDHAFDHP